jgi:hypothetical protein
MSKEPIHHHARFEDYMDILKECLTQFQYLEYVLKDSLVLIEQIVSCRIKAYVPYDPEPAIKSLQKCALGLLIDKYSRYCDDGDFIEEMRRLTKERNKLAHRGFIITTKQSHNEAYIKSESKEWDQVRADTSLALDKLLNVHGALEESLERAKGEEF